jgi:hypothetical protein
LAAGGEAPVAIRSAPTCCPLVIWFCFLCTSYDRSDGSESLDSVIWNCSVNLKLANHLLSKIISCFVSLQGRSTFVQKPHMCIRTSGHSQC